MHDRIAPQVGTDLSEREGWLSTFWKACPVAASIIRVDDGRFVKVNDAFLQLFGYTQSEVLGHSATELGLWSNLPEREDLLARLREGKCVRLCHAKFRRRSGEIGDLSISAEHLTVEGQPADADNAHPAFLAGRFGIAGHHLHLGLNLVDHILNAAGAAAAPE